MFKKATIHLFIMIGLSSFFTACHRMPDRDDSLMHISVEDEKWTAGDGKELTFQAWQATGNEDQMPDSVWVAVHGLGGGSDDFVRVANFLNQHGATVIAPDMRGMGLDPVEENRGDIRTYQEWIKDLEEFLQLVHQAYPDQPLFLHGESLGAVMSLYLSRDLSPEMVKGMVLSAPVIHFRGDVGFWRMQLFRFMRYFLPGKRFAIADMGSAQDTEERLPPTRDPDVLEEIDQARARLQDYTIRLLYESGQLIQNTNARASHNRIPTLIFYAGQDVFIRTDTMESYLNPWKEKGVPLETAYFPDSHHLLTRDLDSQEVFSLWLDWWKRQRKEN